MTYEINEKYMEITFHIMYMGYDEIERPYSFTTDIEQFLKYIDYDIEKYDIEDIEKIIQDYKEQVEKVTIELAEKEMEWEDFKEWEENRFQTEVKRI